MESSPYRVEPVPEPSPGPIHPGSGRRSALKRALGPLAAAGIILVKFGAKAKALLLLLPKVKIFSTSATMLVSIAAYQLIWGWKFSVGFVLLLLLHELGHVIQLRREGVAASAPMFIPFLGAVVELQLTVRRHGELSSAPREVLVRSQAQRLAELILRAAVQ